jgi:hypothetical protein
MGQRVQQHESEIGDLGKGLRDNGLRVRKNIFAGCECKPGNRGKPDPFPAIPRHGGATDVQKSMFSDDR